MINRKEIISELQWLINDFNSEDNELGNMIDRWNNDGDPGSDPGLQYTQEGKIDAVWDEIVKLCSKISKSRSK